MTHTLHKKTTQVKLLIYIFIEATEKTIDLKVKSSATVRDVKAMIEDEEDIPAHQQTLFLPKKQLKDGLTLDQYYLPNNATLHLVQTVEFQEGKDPGEGNLVGLIPCSNLKQPFLIRRDKSLDEGQFVDFIMMLLDFR
ncbi:putative ubiquitin, partial [Tanacetum coccineum]